MFYYLIRGPCNRSALIPKQEVHFVWVNNGQRISERPLSLVELIVQWTPSVAISVKIIYVYSLPNSRLKAIRLYVMISSNFSYIVQHVLFFLFPLKDCPQIFLCRKLLFPYVHVLYPGRFFQKTKKKNIGDPIVYMYMYRPCIYMFIPCALVTDHSYSNLHVSLRTITTVYSYTLYTCTCSYNFSNVTCHYVTLQYDFQYI